VNEEVPFGFARENRAGADERAGPKLKGTRVELNRGEEPLLSGCLPGLLVVEEQDAFVT